MNYIALGKEIRDLRRKRGLTQEQLAELADLSTPYVSHLERGTKKASLAVLVRLAECLSVTVDRLLTGNQETDKTAFYLEVQELLGDCSTRERAILTEIAYAATRSLYLAGKYTGYMSKKDNISSIGIWLANSSKTSTS